VLGLTVADDTRRTTRRMCCGVSFPSAIRHLSECNDMKNDSKRSLTDSRLRLVLRIRSNEVGKEMRQSPVFDQDASAETAPQISAAAALPMPVVTTVPHTMPYYNPQAVSPVPEPTTTLRYTPTQFRTPQDPSSASRHILRSSPNFKPHLK
jgi:hypothetical protein